MFLCKQDSLKQRPGGRIPEIIQVCDWYILIVLDELMRFGVGNLGRTMLLLGYNIDFLTTEARQGNFMVLNKSRNPRVLFGDFSDILHPFFLWLNDFNDLI